MKREELKQKMKDADDKWKRLNIPIHMDVKIEDFLEAFEEDEKEITALKAKLESVQASAYADSVEADNAARRGVQHAVHREGLEVLFGNSQNIEGKEKTMPNNPYKYPLHPGQTHAEPYYCTIPLEEYEALKKRIQELEKLVERR